MWALGWAALMVVGVGKTTLDLAYYFGVMTGADLGLVTRFLLYTLLAAPSRALLSTPIAGYTSLKCCDCTVLLNTLSGAEISW